MKTRELRQKSKDELKELLYIKQVRKDELELLLRQKKAKNVKERANLKKDVARILTLLNKKYEKA